MAERPIPSANSRRARQLLTGAAAGGHAAAALIVSIFFLVGGPQAGLSAAVAAAVTLAFNVVGQAVQVMVADSPAKVMMIAALASYGVRVSLLGIVLTVALANADRLSLMDPLAVVVTTIVVVFGWLASEFWVFTRLRIPAFDPPEQDCVD